MARCTISGSPGTYPVLLKRPLRQTGTDGGSRQNLSGPALTNETTNYHDIFLLALFEPEILYYNRIIDTIYK